MWIFHAIWLGQLIEINLTEGESIVILELMILRCKIFGSWLNNLFIVGECNLCLSAVRNSLDRNHTTGLSQLTDWALCSVLESHSSGKLQSSFFASKCAQLFGALFSQSLCAQRFICHCFVGLFRLGHELIDRVLLVGLPSGYLGRQVADLIENLLSRESHFREACSSLTFRLFTIVSGLHTIGNMGLIGIRFKCLGLLCRNLDR